MPRKYIRKAPNRCLVTDEQLSTAKELIAKGTSKRKAASQVGLLEGTLRKRLKLGKTAEKLGRYVPTFTKAQEEDIYKYVKNFDDLHQGLTMISLQKLIYECAEINKIPHRFNTSLKLAGRDFVYGFLKRYPELKLRQRKTGITKEIGFNKVEVVFTARGLTPPVFTPLNEDGSINYAAILPYANFLANNGIKSVLVGGTTGEHMSHSVADRKKIIEEWVKIKKSTGLHIMVQVGGAPLADVLDLTTFCSKIGADSLLTLPELYFKPQNVSELVSYVELVAKAAPNLPVLYYHIPSMSKVEINMPAFVTEATSRIPNFKGIKFTSNDLSEGAQVLRALKDGQEMFLGADTLLAPAACLGIKSSIGTTFSLFPRLAQDILDAVENGDVPKARALQEKLSLAVEAHTSEGPWVPIMKAGMELVTGIKVGPPALPQRPLSEEAKKRIAARLKALKVIS